MVGKTRKEIVEGYDATGYFDIKEPAQKEETMTNEELVAKHHENLQIMKKAINSEPYDQATRDACAVTGRNLHKIALSRGIVLPGAALFECNPKGQKK